MITNVVLRLIAEVVGRAAISADEPMSRHTTFRIGGPADILIEPPDTQRLAAVLKLIKRFNIPYFVMGNGSNLLVGDKGIRGAVIKIGNGMSECDTDGTQITAQSGIKLSRLANTALKNGLCGLEFASGIPGTLGGAVFMNAGAYGGEMKDVISHVKYVSSKDCEIHTLTVQECSFGYRKSAFSDGDKIVTEAVLNLENGDMDEIKASMAELSAKRAEKQPIDKPSAGSTFKRPEGYFAGTLIQDAGLKGLSIGGAEVSQKHAGFVINKGGATAADVRALIEEVQNRVMIKFGVHLEPEVKFVGEF